MQSQPTEFKITVRLDGMWHDESIYSPFGEPSQSFNLQLFWIDRR